MTGPHGDTTLIEHLQRATHTADCNSPAWAHEPPFRCEKHGPCCDFPLSTHPLPSPKYGPLPPMRTPEDEAEIDHDPSGRMADAESARLYGGREYR